MTNQEKPRLRRNNEPNSIDEDFEAALNDVFAHKLSEEEITENRKRNPKLARVADEIKKIIRGED